jgi:pantetheine-phosphate adenylyltransferase
MKIGFYPGSFNPWHQGHDDILGKALQVFDSVIIGIGHNPEKSGDWEVPTLELMKRYGSRVSVFHYGGFMAEAIAELNKGYNNDVVGVIRGLRNGADFEAEKTMQYWNEDLGLTIPQVHFISDRSLTHVSSSAIRQIRSIGCYPITKNSQVMNTLKES